MEKPKIYLAGPSVFYPDWQRHAEKMKDACEARGAIGLYPMDAEVSPKTGPYAEFAMGLTIFNANTDLIEQSDAVVADLTPFRGPSADVGTVWEIAYAQGRGKPVSGFSTEKQLYKGRVLYHSMCLTTDQNYIPGFNPDGDVDHNGLNIEQFTMAENLMVVGSICRSNKQNLDKLLKNGGLATSFEEDLDMTLENLLTQKKELNYEPKR